MSTLAALPKPFVPGVDRLVDAGANAVLESAQASGLVDQGLVNIISIEAIKQRLEDRWPKRREDIWSYTDRCCQRHLGPTTIVRRLDETDILVVASGDAGAAQGGCLKSLEEVLNFFLGAADLPDIRVRTVTSVSGDMLSCQALDPTQIARGQVTAKSSTAPKAEPEEDPFKNLSPLTFTSITGRPLRVDYHTEPFISIQYSALAAVRLCAVIRREDTGALLSARDISDLPTADILKIDQRAMACIARMLQRKHRRDQAVILPMSLQTTGMVKGRMALAALAADPNLAFKQRGLVEIYDTSLGAPPGRVTELLGLLKTSCRGVILHAPTSPGAASALKYCGQHGLAVTGVEWNDDPKAIALRMLELGENLKGLAPMLAAFDLPSPLFIGVAQTAGFTHASIKPSGD